MSRGRALSLAAPEQTKGLKDAVQRNKAIKMAGKCCFVPALGCTGCGLLHAGRWLQKRPAQRSTAIQMQAWACCPAVLAAAPSLYPLLPAAARDSLPRPIPAALPLCRQGAVEAGAGRQEGRGRQVRAARGWHPLRALAGQLDALSSHRCPLARAIAEPHSARLHTLSLAVLVRTP